MLAGVDYDADEGQVAAHTIWASRSRQAGGGGTQVEGCSADGEAQPTDNPLHCHFTFIACAAIIGSMRCLQVLTDLSRYQCPRASIMLQLRLCACKRHIVRSIVPTPGKGVGKTPIRCYWGRLSCLRASSCRFTLCSRSSSRDWYKPRDHIVPNKLSRGLVDIHAAWTWLCCRLRRKRLARGCGLRHCPPSCHEPSSCQLIPKPWTVLGLRITCQTPAVRCLACATGVHSAFRLLPPGRLPH